MEAVAVDIPGSSTAQGVPVPSLFLGRSITCHMQCELSLSYEGDRTSLLEVAGYLSNLRSGAIIAKCKYCSQPRQDRRRSETERARNFRTAHLEHEVLPVTAVSLNMP